MLLALISFAISDEFSRTVCLCPDYVCNDKHVFCDETNTIDPLSPTFMDDLNLARNNIKNVLLTVKTRKTFAMKLDLRLLSGLNITFEPSYFNVPITISYDSNLDYSGTLLNFEYYLNRYRFVPTFIPIEDKTLVNNLKLDTLNAFGNEVTFCMKGDVPTSLYYSDLNMAASSLKNISTLIKLEVGTTDFSTLSKQSFELLLKTGEKKFSFNGKSIKFSTLEGDFFILRAYKRIKLIEETSFKLTIDKDFPEKEIPFLTFNNFSNVEIYGKMWKPSKTRPLNTLYNVSSLTIPPGDIPLNIYSLNFTLTVSGDATIYGESYIEKNTKFSYLDITSSINSKSKIRFLGLLDAKISIRSPYVDLDISKYVNKLRNSDEDFFPISFSFNEYFYSFVKVREFACIDRCSRNVILDHFLFNSSISTVYTDEELKKIKIFADGFTFFDFPLNVFTRRKFTGSIDLNSLSVQNVIPGFTTSSFCLGIFFNISNTFKFTAKLNRSAYGTRMNLCFTNNNRRCNETTDNPFVSIDIDKFSNENISKYVSQGYKEIYIETSGYSSDSPISLDFDTLTGDGYNITLMSNKFHRNNFIIKAGSNKISWMFIARSNIQGGSSFDIPTLYIRSTQFSNGDVYSFSDTSKVYIDSYSLGYALNSSEKTSFSILNVENDMFYLYDLIQGGFNFFNIVDTIDISDRSMKMCTKISYQSFYVKDPTATFCSEADTQYIDKLIYYSQNSLEFNVNTFPSNMKQFTMYSQPRAGLLNYTISLKGVGWSTKLENKINVNYGKNKIRIAVTKPGQADNLNFIGNGSKHFTIDYIKPQKYCIYDKSANVSCYSNTSISTVMIENNDSLIESLQSIDDISIQLTIDNSAKPIKIPFDYFNLKQIILKTTPKSESLSKIMIDFSKTKQIDLNYSLAVFDGINLDYESQADVDVEFGQVRIDSNIVISSGWTDHVSLTVSQLVCDYSYLKEFKQLTIDDQLNLTGDISSIDKDITVVFKKDDDPNDLVAELSGEVTINVGIESIKVGHLELKITHSENYDAYFKIIKNSNITIISDSNANIDTFPKFVVDTGNNICSFVFKGSFPTISETEESYIKIFGTKSAKVTFSGFLPLSIGDFQNVDIHCEGAKNSLQGPIDYIQASKTEPSIKFYSNNAEKAVIDVIQGINIKEISGPANFTGIMSSNLEVTVRSLTYNDVVQSSISIFTTISNTSSSKIIFSSDFPENIELNSMVYIISDVVGIAPSEEDFIFVKSPEIIIQAKSDDVPSTPYSFEYIRDDSIEGRTHGFYWTMNCLGINSSISPEDSTVQLFAAILPSHVPFVVDIITNGSITNGEITIVNDDKEKIMSLEQYLPKKIDGIRVRLFTDICEDCYIDINKLAKDHDQFYFSLESMSESRFDAFITLPNGNDIIAYFRNINLGVSPSSNNMVAMFINFTDCDFMNAKSFSVTDSVSSLVLDVDSLNGLVSAGALKSYKNKLLIHSANTILFNESGWQFREDLARPSSFISATSFADVTFVTNKFCLLIVGDDVKTAIHGFTLNSYSLNGAYALFEMSAGWGRVKDLGGFNIKIHNADRVLLNSASFPIPKVFDIAEENISYTFETDINGKFDTITYKDGTYTNEKLIANFLFLPPKYRYIYTNNIKFAGNTEFLFQNDNGTVQTNNIELLENSDVKISSLKVNNHIILNRQSTLNTSLILNQSAKMTIKWKLDQVPLIIHNREPYIYPKTLELIYEDTDVDRDLFRDMMINSNGLVLMKGNFLCLKMKNHPIIEFVSSFKPFGKENKFLTLSCDNSQTSQILLLRAKRDIDDDGDDSQDGGGGKDYKVSVGGITGIVIVCVVVCVAIASFIVYVIQKKKIDELKNEIPRGTVEV